MEVSALIENMSEFAGLVLLPLALIASGVVIAAIILLAIAVSVDHMESAGEKSTKADRGDPAE